MYIVITVAAVEAAAATAVVSSAAAAIILVVAVTYTGVYMYIPIYSNGGRSTPAASSAVAACEQQWQQ